MKSILTLLVLLYSSPLYAQNWVPPLGVPIPSFGIIEQAGTFTHYVDNTDPHATNTNNTNGTIEKPRLTIPSGLSAGAVVEVHGGPYSPANFQVMSGFGTATAPVIYHGVDAPIILDREVRISGTYVIVEGFKIERKPARIFGAGVNHVSIRYNEVSGQLPKPGGCAICVGSGVNVVVSNNLLHNNGDPNYFDENDIHGVQVSAGASDIWIVDNEMFGNGGDSVQVNSGVSGILATRIYIGRNRMHSEGENAVDIKQAQDVIISQNDMWGFRPTAFLHSGSDGTAVVINDDNISNGLDNHIWVIANHIHDSTNGVRTQAYAKVIGNVIDHIEKVGIISFGSHNIHVEHNTITDIGSIGISRTVGATTFGLTAIGNIILRVPVAIRVQTIQSSFLANLLLSKPATITWGSTTFTSLATFQAAYPSQCIGCAEGSSIYDEFKQRYQIDLGAQ